jgi:hypothetical protein
MITKFKVTSVSPTEGPTGLRGMVLVSQDGTTFSALGKGEHVYSKGTVLNIPTKKESANVRKYDFSICGLILPKKQPKTSAEALKEIWSK